MAHQTSRKDIVATPAQARGYESPAYHADLMRKYRSEGLVPTLIRMAELQESMAKLADTNLRLIQELESLSEGLKYYINDTSKAINKP